MHLAINNNNSRFSRTGVELVIVGVLTFAAFLFRWAIDPFLGDKHQFLPAYAAIAAATWLMGWRAGALAAVLGLASGELFHPHSAVDATTWHVALAYMGFLAVSVIIVSAAEWLRRDKQEAAAAAAELREADRRKSSFIAVLGHELRSPLATMALGERMLKSGRLDATALRGTAEMMERQTERMTRLVGDLLDVARLQTGKLSLHPALVDVSLLVQEAAAEMRVVTDARQQRLVLLHLAEAGFMHADPVRLHQVLVNLLQNASKFSPEHSDIEIALSGNEGWVTISVKDSGIGIAPSQLQRIFEPFVQLPAGHGEERGLGLGLPLTRDLVEMHGGTVRAFSAGTGSGSEFVVNLPRGVARSATPQSQPAPAASPAAAEPPSPQQKPEPVQSQAQAHPAGRRVLVVDDNADAAATLALLLQLKGHEAFTAGDGRGALEVAEREHPDLVFLDIGLPDMNGLEVARKLRVLLGDRAALVALTGWGSEEDRSRSRAAGCNAHLTKPVDPDAIDAALSLVHGGGARHADAAGRRLPPLPALASGEA